MGNIKRTKSGIEYEDLGDFEVSQDIADDAERRIAQAERDLEEARVNFRWGKEQVQLVKKVADAMGVPYQTYIKQVIYRQALADLERIEHASQQPHSVRYAECTQTGAPPHVHSVSGGYIVLSQDCPQHGNNPQQADESVPRTKNKTKGRKS